MKSTVEEPSTTMRNPGSHKLGIVANEFFDPALGRMGGFGWLAKESARILREDARQRVEPFYLTGELRGPSGVRETRSNGVPLIYSQTDWGEYLKAIRAHKIDHLLTIDYRPDYDYALAALPQAPVVIWVQDPRPPEDIRKIDSLRIPNTCPTRPEGIQAIDCRPLQEVLRRAGASGRKVIFASPAPQLIEKMEGTYGVTPSHLAFLPYGTDVDVNPIRKSPRPRVIFLGRLDPIKRPWVFLEVARSFPDAEFLVMGQSHFKGGGAWSPDDVPGNVRFLGHVDGAGKRHLLSSAWALLNTSIHEALPVSFLEALQFEVPVISCQNPEGIASRFGAYVGRWDGTGLDSVPAFVESLGRILGDARLRKRLGREGRRWVRENHGRDKFLSAFQSLLDDARSEGFTNPVTASDGILPEPWGIPLRVHQQHLMKHDIINLIPPGQPFILVEEEQLREELSSHGRALPFIERDGHYWGAPADDATAIKEFERSRAEGTRYIVFPRSAFWWLDFYSGFCRHLRSNFKCLLENDRAVVFEISR
jgi:glycosyltransferase involved in cell wall biosynthesis